MNKLSFPKCDPICEHLILNPLTKTINQNNYSFKVFSFLIRNFKLVIK